MKRTLAVAGLCVGLLILAACGSSGSQGGDLTGKVWALSELGGKPLVAGSGISAEFTADGQVSGSAGCNRYSGSYTASGNKITFASPMASTRMMCEQAVMDQESAYFRALADAKTYSVSGDQLTLYGADKKALAAYKAQSQDLAGSSWEVIAYNNGKQAVTSVMAGTALTAEFGNDGTLSGNSGCNTYSGSYKVDGDKITIGPLASTMMACGDPAGVMEQETMYLAALQSAATYKIEGNAMELRTADGALAVDLAKK
jgi:heat shock protein HslJ